MYHLNYEYGNGVVMLIREEMLSYGGHHKKVCINPVQKKKTHTKVLTRINVNKNKIMFCEYSLVQKKLSKKTQFCVTVLGKFKIQ